MKIAISTLIFAAAWTIVSVAIAYSLGADSTPGFWTILIGLTGVAIAAALASYYDSMSDNLGYFIMFMGNWFFWWGVIQGFASVKRKFLK
ncbi:MAG: hypothetical protein WCA19_02415 [Candidatus Acidiferrales bacterium]